MEVKAEMISQHIILTILVGNLPLLSYSLNPLLYMKVEKKGKGGTQGIFFTFVLNLGQYLFIGNIYKFMFHPANIFCIPCEETDGVLNDKVYLFIYFEIYLLAFDNKECFLIDSVLYVNIVGNLSYFIIKIEKDFSTDLKMWPAEREVGSVDFLKLLN